MLLWYNCSFLSRCAWIQFRTVFSILLCACRRRYDLCTVSTLIPTDGGCFCGDGVVRAVAWFVAFDSSLWLTVSSSGVVNTGGGNGAGGGVDGADAIVSVDCCCD